MWHCDEAPGGTETHTPGAFKSWHVTRGKSVSGPDWNGPSIRQATGPSSLWFMDLSISQCSGSEAISAVVVVVRPDEFVEWNIASERETHEGIVILFLRIHYLYRRVPVRCSIVSLICEVEPGARKTNRFEYPTKFAASPRKTPPLKMNKPEHGSALSDRASSGPRYGGMSTAFNIGLGPQYALFKQDSSKTDACSYCSRFLEH